MDATEAAMNLTLCLARLLVAGLILLAASPAWAQERAWKKKDIDYVDLCTARRKR